MDLDLRIQGNVRAPLAGEYLRDLTPSDLAQLQDHRGTVVRPIVQLRDSHHLLAMHLADGLPMGTAAQLAGYSYARAAALQSDPTFLQLVAHYRTEKTRPVAADLAGRMLALGVDTIDELRRRLEDEPESFDVRDLQHMVKLLADRTGYGPAAKTMNVNVNVGLAQGLEQARRRMLEAREAAARAASVPLSSEGDQASRSVLSQEDSRFDLPAEGLPRKRAPFLDLAVNRPARSEPERPNVGLAPLPEPPDGT